MSNRGMFRGRGSDPVARLLRLLAPKPTRRLEPPARVELASLAQDRWQEAAACGSADPEAWFPAKGATPVAQVTRICAVCPVNRSCLAVAMLWNEDGIWAGTNPGQRGQGYRLLRYGVSAAVVVELLLTQPNRPGSPACRWSGVAATPTSTKSTATSGPGFQDPPRGAGSGGREAA